MIGRIIFRSIVKFDILLSPLRPKDAAGYSPGDVWDRWDNFMDACEGIFYPGFDG